jgi:hypothetical protein
LASFRQSSNSSVMSTLITCLPEGPAYMGSRSPFLLLFSLSSLCSLIGLQVFKISFFSIVCTDSHIYSLQNQYFTFIVRGVFLCFMQSFSRHIKPKCSSSFLFAKTVLFIIMLLGKRIISFAIVNFSITNYCSILKTIFVLNKKLDAVF